MKRPMIRFDRNSAPVQGQGYGINWDTVDSRYTSLHDYLLTAPQGMDPERLRCLMFMMSSTESQSSTSGQNSLSVFC